MKKNILLFALLVSGFCFSQSVNDYKYVIIPQKFEFLKEADQYSLNSLTKMMFEKYGFEVYYSNDQMPAELALDRCKALYGNILDESGLLGTSLIITLEDCQGRDIFTSEKGKSKQKSYRQAYYEALRDAARSLDVLGYRYAGKDTAAASTSTEKILVQPQKSAVPVNRENQLTAKPVANGYELIDTSGKVVLKMYKTSQPDYYTAQMESVNGVVIKKGDGWVFEFYNNDRLVSQPLNIKF